MNNREQQNAEVEQRSVIAKKLPEFKRVLPKFLTFLALVGMLLQQHTVGAAEENYQGENPPATTVPQVAEQKTLFLPIIVRQLLIEGSALNRYFFQDGDNILFPIGIDECTGPAYIDTAKSTFLDENNQVITLDQYREHYYHDVFLRVPSPQVGIVSTKAYITRDHENRIPFFVDSAEWARRYIVYFVCSPTVAVEAITTSVADTTALPSTSQTVVTQ